MEPIHISNNVVKTVLINDKSSKDIRIKEQGLMKMMVKFYSYKPHLDQMLPILLKKSNVSLRILDYFVTNYALTYKVKYNISLYGRIKRFDVYGSYKSQLFSYHKKLFDPFCRRRRIYFEYAPGCEIETTAGQLNFFRWAIQNSILEYVDNHLELIQADMAMKHKDKLETVVITGEIEKKENEFVAKIGFM
jgi:hypothetical protein